MSMVQPVRKVELGTPLAASPVPRAPEGGNDLAPIMVMLAQIAEDNTLPRNVRKGAQGAREELARESVAVDLRVSSAVGMLDEMASDVNMPVHGRTSIWSVISRLESLQ